MRAVAIGRLHYEHVGTFAFLRARVNDSPGRGLGVANPTDIARKKQLPRLPIRLLASPQPCRNRECARRERTESLSSGLSCLVSPKCTG